MTTPTGTRVQASIIFEELMQRLAPVHGETKARDLTRRVMEQYLDVRFLRNVPDNQLFTFMLIMGPLDAAFFSDINAIMDKTEP